MRPIRQRDSFRCGPVAIVNVRKWLGQKVTYRDVFPLSKKMATTPHSGTAGSILEKELKQCGGKVKRIIHPSVKELNDHIDRGGIVLLRYRWENTKDGEGYHYGVFIKRTPKYFIGWNIIRNQTVSRVSAKRMQQYLRKTKRGGTTYPWAWLIERKPNE